MALDRSVMVLFGNDQITLAHVEEFATKNGASLFQGKISPFQEQEDPNLSVAERVNAGFSGKSSKSRVAGMKELSGLIQTAPSFKAVFYSPDVPELRSIQALVEEHALGLECFSGTVGNAGMFRDVAKWDPVTL